MPMHEAKKKNKQETTNKKCETTTTTREAINQSLSLITDSEQPAISTLDTTAMGRVEHY